MAPPTGWMTLPEARPTGNARQAVYNVGHGKEERDRGLSRTGRHAGKGGQSDRADRWQDRNSGWCHEACKKASAEIGEEEKAWTSAKGKEGGKNIFKKVGLNVA